MKKTLVLISLLLISPFAFAFSYTLEITENELQSRLIQLMPIERKKLFLTVMISEPEVDLSIGNNQIGIKSLVELTAPGGIKAQGRAKINGTLSYDAKTHAFYFKDPQLVSLESNGVSQKLIPQAEKIVQTEIKHYLSRHPVYRLTDANMKHRLAKSVLESVEVKNKLLLVTLNGL